MNRLYRHRHIAAVLILLLAQGIYSCASTAHPDDPPAVKLWKSYGPVLEMSVAVREEVLKAAGAAHRQGTLTDAQLEQVREAGNASGEALKAAKTALEILMLTPADSSNLDKVLVAQQAIHALVKLAVELGFWEAT